jgi:general secretion pathway protein D
MKGYVSIFIILFFLFSGCASVQTQGPAAPPKAKNTVIERPQEISQTPRDKRASVPSENLQLPEFKKTLPEKVLPPSEPIDSKRVVHTEGQIMINVESMSLSDFIIYALGDMLKVTFFIDEQVKNMKDPVTLRMTKEMPVEKVFEIVLGMFEKHDLIVEEKAGALYITRSRLQPKKPVDIRVGRDVPDSPAEVLQVVPLRYLKALEIEGLIRDLYKTGVTIRVYHKENTLLFSGPASAVKEIMDFIEIFDVPYVQDKKAFILKLTYWQTDEFVKQITQILEGIGFSIAKYPKDTGISFIPIKFLNSLLVLAPDDTSAKYVLDWKDRLDTAESAGTEAKSFIYTPRFSKASDLVESLKRLYIGAPTPSTAPAPPSPGQQTPPSPQPSALTIGGAKVAADDKRNVILISASPSEYRGILIYLERLDVPPRQVLIEATIAELTLKDDLRYGLEWYIKNKMVEGEYTLTTLGKLGLTTTTGLTYQFISDTQKFQTAINAFAQENRINILSNPRLMVIDNQEATIQIGTDVPIITGETKSTSAEQLTVISTQSVQYRSTGLIVKVKPTINTEGLLTLDIAIESSEAQTNTISAVDSPLILTRRVNTTVVASTGQMILLGGIMSENLSDTETKVPLLGDIPLLGHLFKTTSKAKTKTELIITIRPVIITSTDEAVRLTNELRQSLKWLK